MELLKNLLFRHFPSAIYYHFTNAIKGNAIFLRSSRKLAKEEKSIVKKFNSSNVQSLTPDNFDSLSIEINYRQMPFILIRFAILQII